MVVRGDLDFLKRLLAYGIDPNSKDYNHRTPLHVAISGGFYLMAKLLLGAGASVFSKDRYDSLPLYLEQLPPNYRESELLHIILKKRVTISV